MNDNSSNDNEVINRSAVVSWSLVTVRTWNQTVMFCVRKVYLKSCSVVGERTLYLDLPIFLFVKLPNNNILLFISYHPNGR